MNASMRWRKVAGDLRLYRLQIAVIVLVLTLGAAGVTAALNAQAILKREIAHSYAAASSADISLWFDHVEPSLLAAVASETGVAGVDARRVAYTRVAARDDTWLLMRLSVVRDFSTQNLDIVHLHNGTWLTGEGSILIEQSGQSMIDMRPGPDASARLQVRTPGGKIMSLPVAGFVHDPAVAPSTQDRMIYAYITPATAVLLGYAPTSDQLLVKMEHRSSANDAYKLGTALQAALTTKGTPALRMDVLPASHPHADLMTAMLRVLGVLSAMAFACSAALVGYTVSAWMRREVRVVGIMKTMGARGYQIALQYLALVGPAVLVALALGLPLGNVLGRAIIDYYAVSLNIDIALWSVPAPLMIQEFFLALSIPLIAMTFPIWRAARMTAQTAIHDAGITALAGPSRLAARLVKIPGHVRWTLAMRNTWRRPWRLLMMVLGLSAGGALVLMTHNNYESLMRVIDTSLANQGHDIEVVMQRAAPAAQLETIARAVPGVKIAEAWRRAGVSLVPVIGSSGVPPVDVTRPMTLAGYPADTQLFKLPVVQGHAPKASADNEILVTRSLLDMFPQLQLNHSVEIQFGERRSIITVVGIVEEIGLPALYADFATFDAVTGLGDSSMLIRVQATGDQIELVVKSLDQAFLNARMTPGQIVSRATIRESLEEHFKVVGDVVRMVALTSALVGAIMLAATTILNISERSREIGILRTLGATPKGIAVLFLAEGASVTILSFVLSVAMSILLTLAILKTVERTLLHVAVPLHFSMYGLAILCSGFLVVLLTVLLAVAHALRKSIRETIAYE